MSSEEVWLLQLWSGTAGAAISAVLAALVAVAVVKSTNSQQRRAAAAALEHSREVANDQLAAARRQLDEQRWEASRQRELAAIADLVAVAAVDRDLQRTEAFFHEFHQKLRLAVARWQLELDDGAMRQELDRWPRLLWQLALRTHDAGLTTDPQSEAWRRLDYGTEAFSRIIMRWPRAFSEAEQNAIAEELQIIRERTANPNSWDTDTIMAGYL